MTISDPKASVSPKGPVPVRRATIRDVSRLASVSRMTVTRVLSEPDLVTDATRERVLRAIADLGYVPDRAAGSLATRRTGFVALMLPTLTNANFSTMAHGLTEALAEKDFHLLITYTNYNVAEEEAQLYNLIARRPEAIVVTGATHSREASLMLMRSHVPVIEVADLPVRPIQHAVGFSNYEIGRMAAQYLIARGFSKIGAIASRPNGDLVDHRGEERIKGLEDELRLNHLSTEAVLRLGDAPVSYEHGSTAGAELLEHYPSVEAVFCVSDLSAIGLMMECQRRGISIPDQVSIMGFGDFDIGRVTNPPLTSIRVDFAGLGKRAGRLVLDLLSGRPVDQPTRIDVGLSIVERGSVRKPI
jgi:LacI family gluconate utilization system Gnt-I transcriptional repressor